ncbi:MAG TPA: MFS transporter [Mycobacteriales bacterium]|nr:MFS transporter [Mycobacteriales bacterium]
MTAHGPRTRRWSPAAGAPLFPLVVLTALYFFDEFDTSAFNVLAPNIKHAFHLSNEGFAFVVALNLSIVLLLAIPAGFLGDRAPRRTLTVLCAIAAGTFSLATGLVGGVVMLAVVRIGNGIGNLSNTTFQESLLTDYYPPEARAGVFSGYLATPSIASVIGGVTVGALASTISWRAPFFIFFIPIVITGLVCIRLREPTRGESDDPTAAAEVAAEAPPRFGESARALWSVPTLRREYIAFAFIGAGLLPLAYTIPLFYEQVFHIGEFGRGLLTSASSVALVLGALASGPLTRRWLNRDVGLPLRWVGAITAVTGGLVIGMAAAPTKASSIALALAAYFVAGMYAPPFVTVQSLVAPARMRTLAFSFAALFSVAGLMLLYFVIPVASLADQHGMRVQLASGGPYWVIAGIILSSAARFVPDDAAAALRSLAAMARLRERQADGQQLPLLSCAGLDVAYDSVQVVFGVDLDIQQGEIVALLGTNGAGKSTVLKAISGLQMPSAGTIFFEGQDVTYLDAKTKFRAGIVQMPGGRSVFPTLTVDECLRLAAWTRHGSTDEASVAEREVLAHFPILATRGRVLAGNLSGGEQQMLGLAMALISKPTLLMIDELSLGLAPTIVAQLVEIVRAIHAQGTTVVVVEQSVNVALTLAERAIFLEKGEVRFSGPTAELLDRPDILRAVFLEGAAGGKPAARTAPRGRPAKALRDRRTQLLAGPAILEVVDLHVDYGGIRAVDGASVTVHRGEVVGLIGPNGAGKTTLFDAVSGFAPSHAGFVILGGDDVTAWSADRRARAGLGRSFQDARIFPSLTVVENLALALERHLDVRDPLACALGLPAVIDSESAAAIRVHELIELLGLAAYRNKFVGELSTGTRRIVDLGMAVAHRPTVLLLDEPSSGIAQRETEALGPVLKRIQCEIDCALLVIEHDMPLITSIADTLIALKSGQVIAEGAPDEVVRHPRVVASYLGTDETTISRSGSRTARKPGNRR